MQREGQPRGIQRLFRLMKRAEAQGNQVHQPQREPQQRTTNQDQTRTPSASLIPEHKAALGAYCEWLDQTIQTDRERRANEPKPKELQVEDWIAYHEMRKSQEPIQFAPL